MAKKKIAPSITKLRATLAAMSTPEKGEAAIPDFDILKSEIGQPNVKGAIWDEAFTVSMDDDQYYWNNLVFAAAMPYEGDGKMGIYKFLPGTKNEINFTSDATGQGSGGDASQYKRLEIILAGSPRSGPLTNKSTIFGGWDLEHTPPESSHAHGLFDVGLGYRAYPTTTAEYDRVAGTLTAMEEEEGSVLAQHSAQTAYATWRGLYGNQTQCSLPRKDSSGKVHNGVAPMTMGNRWIGWRSNTTDLADAHTMTNLQLLEPAKYEARSNGYNLINFQAWTGRAPKETAYEYWKTRRTTNITFVSPGYAQTSEREAFRSSGLSNTGGGRKYVEARPSSLQRRSCDGIPNADSSVAIPKSANTAKMYMKFVSNLINGLRLRHAHMGPWANETEPREFWELLFKPYECKGNNVAIHHEDWLDQIEATPADQRAAWNARIILADGFEDLDQEGSGRYQRALFARGLDTRGMQVIRINDADETTKKGLWDAITGDDNEGNPFVFGSAKKFFSDHTLSYPIIDGISKAVAPGAMAHASYIPAMPLAEDAGGTGHPLQGYETEGSGDSAGRFIHVPGIPSTRGVLDAKPVIGLLDGGKSMKELVEELYDEWLTYRLIAAQSMGNLCEEGEIGDRTGQVGLDGGTAKEQIEAAKERAGLVAQIPDLLELAFTNPLDANFREQCYLLSNVFNFAGARRKNLLRGPKKRATARGGYKPLPYIPSGVATRGNAVVTNASLEIDGSTFGFMNMLTGDPKIYPLMQAHHSQLSALQPSIRLFKVVENRDAQTGNRSLTEQEFNFDSHEKNYKDTGLDQLLQNSRTRGYGSGIKSFEFTYDGSNPFAAKKSIKAKLVIFANSFDELMKCRGGDCEDANATDGYRYLDLALKTGRGKTSTETGDCPDPTLQTADPIMDNSVAEESELAKLRFRLKAVVGYAKPPRVSDPDHENIDTFWNVKERGDRIGILHRAGTMYNDIYDAVAHSYVSLNLTPTVHNFAFDDQGRVTMTIDYLAYVEDFFDSASFNIFTDIEVAKSVLNRKMRFKKLARFCEAEKMSKIREGEVNEIGQAKIDALQSLLKQMFKNERIHQITLDYDKLAKWRKKGPFATGAFPDALTIRPGGSGANFDLEGMVTGQVAESLSPDTDKSKMQLAEEKRNRALNNSNSQSFQFFYVGDLVDQILEGLETYLSEETGMIAAIETMARYSPTHALHDASSPLTECEIEFEKYKIRKFAEQFKHFRTVLGPVELVNPGAGAESKFTNFGNIPVSVKYFTEWLTKQLISKERAEYPLPHFLNNFFNLLVRDFLNNDQCFKTNIKQKVRVNQAVVTDYTSQEAWEYKIANDFMAIDTLSYDTLKANRNLANEGYKPLRVTMERLQYSPEGKIVSRQRPAGAPARLPVLNIAGPGNDRSNTAQHLEGGLERETNYLVYYAGRTKPTELMRGDPAVDINNGILHYGLGLQNGIVKNIALTKTQAPYLPEVRFEQEGYDGLEQLRVTYDATITTFPLPNAFPGQYLYINPRTFAPGSTQWKDRNAKGELYDLTKFGIGGYFMIIRSTHAFGPGSAKTSIEAKWVAEHENPNKDIGSGGEVVEEATSAVDRTRCTSVREKRAAGSLGEYLEALEEQEETEGFQPAAVDENPAADGSL